MSAQTLTRAVALTRVLGQSGRHYLVERILQDKPGNQGRVYLATSGDHKYVLKSVAPRDFKYFKDMFDDLRSSPYLRVSVDACPDESVFVYKYLRDHLLSFVQNEVPLPITKRILRDALRGITTLHGKGIIHTDIKANNILIEWKDQGGEITVEQVQVADIEDAAYVPKDCVIKGRQVGNWMWRSPEAHASAEVHTPSDMFSFGLVLTTHPSSGESQSTCLFSDICEPLTWLENSGPGIQSMSETGNCESPSGVHIHHPYDKILEVRVDVLPQCKRSSWIVRIEVRRYHCNKLSPGTIAKVPNQTVYTSRSEKVFATAKVLHNYRRYINGTLRVHPVHAS
ncbi:kinase-like protein [Trematosphaeria pertusa]|uniref:Kinase-like protein n=1 Tax=Trematosphaeria pertusa TaxID=390896 RepID=A0A6A6IUW9_9PLEO|nr:kinase-like protein [Trematosphaeria pertusa]KAF2254365.1 kinase-like protein [Trematosphaeria pertusa]